LLHAVRVRLHFAVDRIAEIGHLKRAVEIRLAHLLAACAPEKLEVLHPGQVRNESRLLNQNADASQCLHAGLHARAEQSRFAGVRMYQPDQHAKGGRLAGAVRSPWEPSLPLTPPQTWSREPARSNYFCGSSSIWLKSGLSAGVTR